jgi:putative cell wall-binding protein
VVLARSDDFPDALAGSPLAAVRNAPLLITDPQALDPRVSAEISRVLAPDKTVYILGGGAAISPGVEAAVAALGYQVVRYAGSDRYGTAATIAASGLGSPSTVLEANGEDFPDAVAAGAAAGALHGAVLLTAGSALPAATSAYLSATNPSVRIAVGGPAAAADPGATPVVGADRYATAALLAQQYFPGPTLAGVASGANWPDALAGGSRLGARAGPLLLSDPAGLSDEAATYISTHSPGLADVEIYGGSAALTPNLEPSILSDVSG